MTSPPRSLLHPTPVLSLLFVLGNVISLWFAWYFKWASALSAVVQSEAKSHVLLYSTQNLEQSLTVGRNFLIYSITFLNKWTRDASYAEDTSQWAKMLLVFSNAMLWVSVTYLLWPTCLGLWGRTQNRVPEVHVAPICMEETKRKRRSKYYLLNS